MGSYESIFDETEDQKKRNLDVTKSDWITGHADLTGSNLKNFFYYILRMFIN
jgi:hypothetical protein